ncbi:MAG: ABC transporter ATP-binding protein [Baekduia sp.]
MTESAPIAVSVRGVDKSFRLPREQVHTLKERLVHPFRRTGYDRFDALKDVSFDIQKGEFFGIVGRNGSGKSTLLKCLAGIYAADDGQIRVDGRVSTFIELGVGFNQDLPARDNILINATMLGLTQRQARERVDEVLRFAELEEFVDLKLKNYSSGMLVRLAFSVMIQVDADVLLIDEVLAVGDAAFQQKCYDEFARLRREGRTVVLVTHEMGAVERFCDRAMLIERGEVLDIGPARDVSTRYVKLNFEHSRTLQAPEDEAEPEPSAEHVLGSDRPTNPGEVRAGSGDAEILAGWFADERGNEVASLDAGSKDHFCIAVKFHTAITGATFAFQLTSGAGQLIAAATTHEQFEDISFAAGEQVTVTFSFPNVLAPERYQVSAAVSRPGSGQDWLDYRDRFGSVIVGATRPSGAVVDLPTEFWLTRADETVETGTQQAEGAA